MNLTTRVFSIIYILAILGSCSHKELRGKYRKSDDKGTYLIIEEGCGADNKIIVDGQEWPHKIGEKGKIEPGDHTLICGGKLYIQIKKGTVFHFDYWGP